MWRIASTTSLKLAERYCRRGVISSYYTGRLNEEITRAASSTLLLLPCKSSIGGRSSDAANVHRITFSNSENRVWFSTTRNKHGDQNRKKSKQIEINGRIIAFGKKKDWASILDMYENEKQHYNHINYATSMSQLGRIQSFPKDDRGLEDLMIAIATQLQIPTGSWDARHIANMLHAVAKMQLKSDASWRLIDSILSEPNLKIIADNGTAQAIANTAWACAKLGVECPSLFRAIENNALFLIENGNSQDIANTAWACAKLTVECPSLFQAIDNNALYLVENGNCQDISNTAWACAKLAVECPSLFQAIDSNALYLVENGNSQNIANTAWACATLGVECPSLFRAIENNALFLVENGNSKNIAIMAWACATLGVKCPILFKATGSCKEA